MSKARRRSDVERTMKAPRDLWRYLSARDAAKFLERRALELRKNAKVFPKVKVDITLWFWNPAWGRGITSELSVRELHSPRPHGGAT